MDALISKSEISLKNKIKTQIKLPKIVLGTGRDLAEIDYDALFDIRKFNQTL